MISRACICIILPTDEKREATSGLVGYRPSHNNSQRAGDQGAPPPPSPDRPAPYTFIRPTRLASSLHPASSRRERETFVTERIRKKFSLYFLLCDILPRATNIHILAVFNLITKVLIRDLNIKVLSLTNFARLLNFR